MNIMDINSDVYKAQRNDIIEALGLLPHWVIEYNLLGGEDLVQHMENSYGFGSLYRFGGEVLDNGNYRSHHEEDEDLDWIAKMKTKDGDVYFYPYAITALPTSGGEYFITRMD